jgi:hypothetical protein
MTINEEIIAERNYQIERWGHKLDDTVNKPNDWVAYIAHHSTRWSKGGFPPYNAETVESFRCQMIKTAAIAVAAVESLDRQIEENGKPFYQE